MKKLIGLWIFLAANVLLASTGQAAVLQVFGGRLSGATGVDVGGTLYDVAFMDGTCVELFNGCNDASDFTFRSEQSASLAAQALLDQVFINVVEGNFDDVPILTKYCEGSIDACRVLTPFGFRENNSGLRLFQNVQVANRSSDNKFQTDVWDVTDSFLDFTTFHTGSPGFSGDTFVYALWSVVPAQGSSSIPEPSTLWILLASLAGLARLRPVRHEYHV